MKNEHPIMMGMLGASYLICGDIDKGLMVFKKMAKMQIKISAYVHSLLEPLIFSGQMEYFNRLIDAILANDITNCEALRLRLTPGMNKTAQQLYVNGKNDEAMLILNAAVKNEIHDAATMKLLDVFQNDKSSAQNPS